MKPENRYPTHAELNALIDEVAHLPKSQRGQRINERLPFPLHRIYFYEYVGKRFIETEPRRDA